jgi:biopolymer transport protein ExbD
LLLDEIWINKRRVDARAVQANIERLRAENPQGSVVIQADKKSTTEALMKVLDASRAAGVMDAAVATAE